jgi:hypothetical protein
MMKITKLILLSMTVALLGWGCSKSIEEVDSQTRSQEYEGISGKYTYYSDMPTVSALQVTMGQETVPAGKDFVVELTQDDVEYLTSLSIDDLERLKTQIMEAYGLNSEEEIENSIDMAFDNICKDMSEEEEIQFYQFVTGYLDETPLVVNGKVSKENTKVACIMNSELEDVYIRAAVAIDKFARPLYNTIGSTRSAGECKKYLAYRLAIASISCMYTAMFPGGGAVAVVQGICEGITAINYYRVCLRTR